MPLLHDPDVRDATLARVNRLAPDTKGRWGKLSVDQMLWHVNRMLSNAVGELDPEEIPVPIPRGLAKFLVLYMPWPKNAPTQPAYQVPADHYVFAEERDRCLRLIDQVASRDLDGVWGNSAAFRHMSGRDWSRLNARHLDHHLRQFGV